MTSIHPEFKAKHKYTRHSKEKLMMLDQEACILAERYVQLRELSIFSQEAFFIAIISFVSFLKKMRKELS
ncbi:MAG: hypothetical protein ACTSUJ_02505 [Candidatus Njordarchaeales archaeon]